MVRNIPNKYTQAKLLETLDDGGQAGKYDFVYMPVDQKNQANVGYAFVNFIHPLYIVDFYYRFIGKRWKCYNSTKICDLKYGRLQGKKQLENNFSTMQHTNDSGGKTRPFIADRPCPSIDELEKLREDLIKDYDQRNKESSGEEETKAPLKKDRPKKATIKIHKRLDMSHQQVTYRRKEIGTKSTGGSAEKAKRDVVLTGGDYDDANDYEYEVRNTITRYPKNSGGNSQKIVGFGAKRESKHHKSAVFKARTGSSEETMKEKKVRSAFSGKDSDYMSQKSG